MCDQKRRQKSLLHSSQVKHKKSRQVTENSCQKQAKNVTGKVSTFREKGHWYMFKHVCPRLHIRSVVNVLWPDLGAGKHRPAPTIRRVNNFRGHKKNLPPELQELILKEYISIKMKQREEIGWKEVYKELGANPFCLKREMFVKIKLCRSYRLRSDRAL